MKRYIEGRFKNVHFVERDEGWIFDAYSDMKVFEDSQNGITISYRMQRKEVLNISWSDPKLFAEMGEKEQKRKLSSTLRGHSIIT